MSSDHPLLPLLPLRDIVVFPFMVIPLFVGREKSVCALEKSMAEQKNIFLGDDSFLDIVLNVKIYDLLIYDASRSIRTRQTRFLAR